MTEKQSWYVLPDEAHLATPALVFYEERLKANIVLLQEMIDRSDRLRPHVKTYKCREITRLLQAAGINKFKCATIAEAEMLAIDEAKDVMLAYQPVGENIVRLFKLKKRYPQTVFSCLTDHADIASELNEYAENEGTHLDVYIDLNVGMNRTGILPELSLKLLDELLLLDKLHFKGIHAYDGHIHDSSFALRAEKAGSVIVILQQLKKDMEAKLGHEVDVVAGGTPTFPIYAKETSFDCSPGTFILWDKGYQDAYQEQPFFTAALVASRIVSFPAAGLLCTDLGHKAVAAEKELRNRVFFINAPELQVQSQSEEHLVLSTADSNPFQLGDLLYGLPYHICPTVALHEKAICLTVEGSIKEWEITSRKRKITI